VLCAWYFVLGIDYRPSTKYQVPSTKYQLPSTISYFFLIAVTLMMPVRSSIVKSI